MWRLKEECILLASMDMESQNMPRGSINQTPLKWVNKEETGDEKLQRMGCWKAETSNPQSDV